jgi:hypothetical protein
MCRTPSTTTDHLATDSHGSDLSTPDSEVTALNFTKIFQPRVSAATKIFHPADEGYTTEIKQRWTTWQPPSYVAAIKPVTEKDISIIVRSLL